MIGTTRLARIVAIALVLGTASSAFAGDDGAWTVSKSSGEVWITTGGAEPASLKQEEALKPGDTIRTGRNGRVLLKRGEESMLIAPNSVVGLPTEKKEGLSTTIVHQAGSILLEVEKRNVKHFEVETPYLAAVVKGTQFQVTVNAASTSVNVLRGQVEVADFKSGQIAQVMPGQMATVLAHGKPGLSLSGSGTFNPIEQGKPRASSIERIMVPKTGLTAPRSASNGQSNRAFGHVATSFRSQRNANSVSTKPRVTKISTALGEVRVNFHKVTHGLVHGSDSASSSSLRDARASLGAGNGSGQGNSNNSGSSGGAATGLGATTTSGASVPVAAVTAAGGNSGNGNNNGNNGNGNNGNGNGHGHGHGNNGNGNNGNGNNGNGNNGNGNNGNGNGNGH